MQILHTSLFMFFFWFRFCKSIFRFCTSRTLVITENKTKNKTSYTLRLLSPAIRDAAGFPAHSFRVPEKRPIPNRAALDYRRFDFVHFWCLGLGFLLGACSCFFFLVSFFCQLLFDWSINCVLVPVEQVGVNGYRVSLPVGPVVVGFMVTAQSSVWSSYDSKLIDESNF